MNIFAKNAESDDAKWERIRQEREDAAKAAESGVLATADAHMAAALTEYDRDFAGFQFRCQRHGDFLALFITRDNPRTPEHEYDWSRTPTRDFATAVNLGLTREIKLIEGHGPDRNGEVTYYVSQDWETREQTVKPQVPLIPYARESFFRLDPEPSPNNGAMISMGGNGDQIRFRTKNYPRPAEDDSIRFSGLRGTLYVPFGRGAAVRDAILAEIETLKRS